MNAGRPVAVIDIGSNSIKILVAARAADGAIATLRSRTLDARISAGISKTEPRLSPEGMQRGVEAIRTLLADASEFDPATIALVATSAVRDALNRDDFLGLVRNETGATIRVLTGEEEANLIGRGLTCDPALRQAADFQVFDLGGGSLECLDFTARRVTRAISLPLGCVRLTERFVAEPSAPFASDVHENVARHSRELLSRCGFPFGRTSIPMAVATGGTAATARGVLGMRDGRAFDATAPTVSVSQLRELLTWLGSLPLAQRRSIPGLPPARADVFPTALATLLVVAELGRFSAFTHSLYNLRFGIADALLSGDASFNSRSQPSADA